jgi:hypothetical protein
MESASNVRRNFFEKADLFIQKMNILTVNFKENPDTRTVDGGTYCIQQGGAGYSILYYM